MMRQWRSRYAIVAPLQLSDVSDAHPFLHLFSPGLAAGKCALRAFCFGRSTRSYACNTASGGLMTGCAIRFRYGGLMMVCAIRFRYCGLIMGYIRRLFNLIPKTLYLIFKFQRIISSGYLARHPVNIYGVAELILQHTYFIAQKKRPKPP